GRLRWRWWWQICLRESTSNFPPVLIGFWLRGSGCQKKQPVDLGLLEEDDEFEEFPAEDWTGLDEDEDAHVWEGNWDDDKVEDDFSNQLRAELEKHGYKMETS
ncbi:26S proteasome complex subunit SEM1-like, partial [Molossus nigricans]